MDVRNTVNLDLARKALEAAGDELLERMAHYLEGRAKQYCPVDTGELWNSITIISAGGHLTLYSGSAVGALSNPGSARTAYVAALAPYALYVHNGHFAGLSWVPPNPFMANAMADTIGAFSQIVNAEVFYPFRGGGGWGEIVSSDAGSSSPRGPLAGPAF